MPLKTFDSKDAVPAELRDKAIETRDSKWIVEEPVDLAALRAEGQRALDAERTRAENEEKERKKLAKELADLKRDQAAAGKGVSAEELERLRKEDADARRPLEERVAALEKENRTLKLDDKVRQIALDKGIMKDRIKKAMKDLEGRFELTSDGTGIVVKDADGKATTESVESFFEKTYKAESPFFYQADTGSGSGAGSGGSDSGSGYDPVAAGKAAAEKQKKESAAASSLAFK